MLLRQLIIIGAIITGASRRNCCVAALRLTVGGLVRVHRTIPTDAAERLLTTQTGRLAILNQAERQLLQSDHSCIKILGHIAPIHALATTGLVTPKAICSFTRPSRPLLIRSLTELGPEPSIHSRKRLPIIIVIVLIPTPRSPAFSTVPT